MTLRQRADNLHVDPPKRSIIDVLLEDVTPKQRAEILDLLTGHPQIRHTITADVLNEAFAGTLTKPIIDGHVRRWRQVNKAAT